MCIVFCGHLFLDFTKCMRLLYMNLSQMRKAYAQTSLCIRVVSSELWFLKTQIRSIPYLNWENKSEWKRLPFRQYAWIEKIPPGWGWGVRVGWSWYFWLSTYFTEGRTDLTREAIGPNGSNCFSRGLRTSIYKGPYSYLWFSRRGLALAPFLWTRP